MLRSRNPKERSIPWDINCADSLQLNMATSWFDGLAEPAQRQAFPQAQTRPMQLHPAIGRGDRQFLTNFFGGKSEKLAHHENPAGLGWHAVETGFENCPELLLLQRSFGIGPSTGHLGPMAIGLE